MTNACANCGAPVADRYCPRCGQATTDYNVPLNTFLKEFASEVFSLDSRLLHTLKPLVLQPGLVAEEYVAGHRVRFVPPVRLYIFASFVMFVMMSLTSETIVRTTGPAADSGAVATVDSLMGSGDAGQTTDGSVDSTATRDDLTSRLVNRLGQNLRRALEQGDAFTRVFLNRMAQAMFFLLPVFALLLKLLYPRRLYVQHLVYSVYFHSFVFLFVTLLTVPELLGLDRVNQAMSFGLLWVPPHLFLGMRRLYQESRLRTLVKWSVLVVTYFVAVVITVFVLLVGSLLLF